MAPPRGSCRVAEGGDVEPAGGSRSGGSGGAGGEWLCSPSRDAARRSAASHGRGGADEVEVEARRSRPSRVTKAFLLDHVCAGSWCQQTARAFPCGQWHPSCVKGSLCAFETRMETGLFCWRQVAAASPTRVSRIAGVSPTFSVTTRGFGIRHFLLHLDIFRMPLHALLMEYFTQSSILIRIFLGRTE